MVKGGRGAKKASARSSKSAKAGLVFPVSRIHRFLKTNRAANRVSATASVYATAVLEYLCAEVLELSGNCSRSTGKKRIVPRHILLALKADEEFNIMMNKSKVVIPDAGVPPNIQSALLTEKQSSSKMFSSSVGNSQAVPAVPTATSKKATASAAAVASSKLSKVKRAATVESLGQTMLFLGKNLKIVKSNIAKFDQADAVVHPTNSNLSSGGQVGQELLKYGGEAFRSILDSARPTTHLSTTECCITAGGDLNAKYVIHCNSPSWHGPQSSEQLKQTIENILTLADQKKLKSVALPSIGSGANGFPKDVAARVILHSINSFFMTATKSGLETVHFVLYDEDSVKVYNDVYAHEFGH